MNKIVTIIFIALFLIFGIVLYVQNNNTNQKIKQLTAAASPTPVTKSNCVGETCLHVNNFSYPAGKLTNEAQDAITQAIIDEYKAHATYKAVIDKFGMIRPFAMIIRSEEQHIASLKSLFDKYGITIPNDETGTIRIPQTITESCQIGVDAEIANAALYRDTLLPKVTNYPDITSVFTTLMNASEQRHLTAFERCNE